MSLAFPSASPAEALLAAEKDEAYVRRLSDRALAALALLAPPRRLEAWRSEVKLGVALAYHALAAAGRTGQTVGEQYCDVAAVRASDGLAAEPARRGLAVALGVALPYWLERLGERLLRAARRCEAAETRYECKKLGVSDTLLWNLLRAMLLIVFSTLVLPVLLPWLKAQMPSYGLMSNEAYERQCELTTEKELAKLRQQLDEVQRREERTKEMLRATQVSPAP